VMSDKANDRRVEKEMPRIEELTQQMWSADGNDHIPSSQTLDIESAVRQINRELVPRFEENLRGRLITQDKAWLIEQIVRLTLDAHTVREMDLKRARDAKAEKRAERIGRLRELGLDREKLRGILERYGPCTRDQLTDEGCLLASAPAKGTALITNEVRTPEGEALLIHAKDILFGLLFGDESMNVRFDRIEQELLTLTLPRHKARALDFMKATTELSAVGTWQEPESVSNDSRADNVVLEAEYGEVPGELIGQGIAMALSLISNLEVNEQILYARMVNVEQSTLIR
jgi:hypothetical protein